MNEHDINPTCDVFLVYKPEDPCPITLHIQNGGSHVLGYWREVNGVAEFGVDLGGQRHWFTLDQIKARFLTAMGVL